jgi:hypothetical protein
MGEGEGERAKRGMGMDRFEELKEKVLPLLKPYGRRVAVFGS